MFDAVVEVDVDDDVDDVDDDVLVLEVELDDEVVKAADEELVVFGGFQVEVGVSVGDGLGDEEVGVGAPPPKLQSTSITPMLSEAK